MRPISTVMDRRLSPRTMAALLALTFICLGCGETGSNPPSLPEMRITFAPQLGGAAEFEVVEVQAGGRSFSSLANQRIRILGPFNLFVENAPEPFGVIVRLLGEAPLEVRYGLAGVSSGSGMAVVSQPGVATAVGEVSSSVLPSRPEVRVDVCAPFGGESQCSPFDGESVFGAQISGSIGDPDATRLTGRGSGDEPEVVTPAVYFYAEPHDSIAAIQRALDGRFMRLRLYLNGQLKDEDSDTNDVVVRSDL